MKFQTSVLSRIGGRRSNQDYCGFVNRDEMNLWVVADGMGGHFGGEMASSIATNAITDHFQTISAISEENTLRLLSFANEQVIKGQKEIPYCESMQTTIALVVSNGENTMFANVGDSRCYYFTDGVIIKRSTDHSIPQLLVSAGEIKEKDVRTHPDRNKVLRSIGKDDSIKPDIFTVNQPLKTGDAFLLCTDGFWELIIEKEMEVDLIKSITPEEWLRKMELRLLTRMSETHDNYSAVAVFYQ